MVQHPVQCLIEQADAAINREDFDALLAMYTEDALLVIKPGVYAIGKVQIREAFQRIATYFEHTLVVQQAAMEILETGDTALVLAKTLVTSGSHPAMERKATYVFRRQASGLWLCAIDNSYGHDLLEGKA